MTVYICSIVFHISRHGVNYISDAHIISALTVGRAIPLHTWTVRTSIVWDTILVDLLLVASVNTSRRIFLDNVYNNICFLQIYMVQLQQNDLKLISLISYFPEIVVYEFFFFPEKANSVKPCYDQHFSIYKMELEYDCKCKKKMIFLDAFQAEAITFWPYPFRMSRNFVYV